MRSVRLVPSHHLPRVRPLDDETELVMAVACDHPLRLLSASQSNGTRRRSARLGSHIRDCLLSGKGRGQRGDWYKKPTLLHRPLPFPLVVLMLGFLAQSPLEIEFILYRNR